MENKSKYLEGLKNGYKIIRVVIENKSNPELVLLLQEDIIKDVDKIYQKYYSDKYNKNDNVYHSLQYYPETNKIVGLIEARVLSDIKNILKKKYSETKIIQRTKRHLTPVKDLSNNK